jgi:chromosome segregation ATPase
MAPKGTYETIKQAFQDIIAPQLERINGEIAGLKTQIHSLERRTDEGFMSIRNEMGSLRAEMGSLRNEMDSLRGEMRQGLAYSNKRVDEVLEIRERLAVLEAKLATRN